MLSIIIMSLILFSSCTIVVRSQDSCISDPTTPNCVNYQYSGTAADIQSMCSGSMGNMPGCTLSTLCSSDQTYAQSQYCNQFAILKTVCGDMGMMLPCKNYRSMCQTNGSVIQQCQVETLPIPTSVAAADQITSICDAMSMPTCSQCNARMTCDLLTVYSDLCLSMPMMTDCKDWNDYCTLVPDWPLCSSEHPDSTAPPQMRMYFHTGIYDYILFESWIPRSNLGYAGSWFAIVLISIVYEALKSFRVIWEKRLDAARRNRDSLESRHKTFTSRKDHVGVFVRDDIPRGLLRMFENGLSLIIMLVAMTFNVGLFLAILVGTFIGAIAFGRIIAKYNTIEYSFGETAPDASCH